MGSAWRSRVVAILRELGPVLTALMVTVASAQPCRAEIGTMKVTEQIDALRALAVYPTDYLVVPRALAMMVLDALARGRMHRRWHRGRYFVAIFCSKVNGTYTWRTWCADPKSRHHHGPFRKRFCFGIPYALSVCHKGLTAREGAVGVGRATTEAVVNASLAVLISNFFLTMLLNIIYPAGLSMSLANRHVWIKCFRNTTRRSIL